VILRRKVYSRVGPGRKNDSGLLRRTHIAGGGGPVSGVWAGRPIIDLSRSMQTDSVTPGEETDSRSRHPGAAGDTVPLHRLLHWAGMKIAKSPLGHLPRSGEKHLARFRTRMGRLITRSAARELEGKNRYLWNPERRTARVSSACRRLLFGQISAGRTGRPRISRPQLNTNLSIVDKKKRDWKIPPVIGLPMAKADGFVVSCTCSSPHGFLAKLCGVTLGHHRRQNGLDSSRDNLRRCRKLTLTQRRLAGLDGGGSALFAELSRLGAAVSREGRPSGAS